MDWLSAFVRQGACFFFPSPAAAPARFGSGSSVGGSTTGPVQFARDGGNDGDGVNELVKECGEEGEDLVFGRLFFGLYCFDSSSISSNLSKSLRKTSHGGIGTGRRRAR